MIHHSLNYYVLTFFILLHGELCGVNKDRKGKTLLEPLVIFQQTLIWVTLLFFSDECRQSSMSQVFSHVMEEAFMFSETIHFTFVISG